MPHNLRHPRLDQSALYTIKVEGRLDANWAEWFGGMHILVTRDAVGQVFTTLTGWVIDQAALHGLLARIRDLCLPLLLVQCLEVPAHLFPAGRDDHQKQNQNYSKDQE